MFLSHWDVILFRGPTTEGLVQAFIQTSHVRPVCYYGYYRRALLSIFNPLHTACEPG
jgi:hypothetical protein